MALGRGHWQTGRAARRGRNGRTGGGRAAADRAVLHPPGDLGDLRAVYREGGRDGDVFYRDRWSHDKVVRSTHGVNCTGSCSWKVYVKDGIITWETQQTDYPSVGPDSPEYEPRGCPRGAAFSWYTYSPTRVRYPYARGVLVEMYREAKARLGDPVRGLGGGRQRPGQAPALPAGPRQGRARAGVLGRGRRDRRGRARAHDQDLRPGPDRRVLPDPGDVDGQPRGRDRGSSSSSAAR